MHNINQESSVKEVNMNVFRQKKTGFLFSVYRNEDSHLSNLNHEQTINNISKGMYSYKEMHEYSINQDGKYDLIKMIYIEVPNENIHTLNETREYVKTLVTQHNQNAFLEISPERVVKSHGVNGEYHVQGSLVAVSENEATQESVFIYCPINQVHFVVRR